MTNTNDLSEFGNRELKESARLLNALCDEDKNKTEYLSKNVKLEFNPNSGNVFLVDEDYNTAMMNGDKLEDWFNCPNCGHEGFKQDMNHNSGDEDCLNYLKDIGILE